MSAKVLASLLFVCFVVVQVSANEQVLANAINALSNAKNALTAIQSNSNGANSLSFFGDLERDFHKADNFIKRAAHDVDHDVRKVTHDIEHDVDKVASDIRHVAKKIAHGIERGAIDVEHAVSKVGRVLAKDVDEFGQYLIGKLECPACEYGAKLLLSMLSCSALSRGIEYGLEDVCKVEGDEVAVGAIELGPEATAAIAALAEFACKEVGKIAADEVEKICEKVEHYIENLATGGQPLAQYLCGKLNMCIPKPFHTTVQAMINEAKKSAIIQDFYTTTTSSSTTTHQQQQHRHHHHNRCGLHYRKPDQSQIVRSLGY